jgi:xanthine dehydrogenase accessory factor
LIFDRFNHDKGLIMKDIFEEIVKIRRKGKSAAVATIIKTSGSTPREQGSKMLVLNDGSILGSIGGGKLEAIIQQEALKVIANGKARTLHLDLSDRDAGNIGMICGGTTDILIEPVLPTPTLYLFGAGHISIPLSMMGGILGFKVVVIDNRVDFANKVRFPDSDKIYANDFNLVFPKLKIDRSSYIVIVTRGHSYDEFVLEWAVKTDAAYIGMIGSKQKVRTIFSHLFEKGINHELIQKIHAPIGLEIYAETPQEIAVSIMAEIIKDMRKPSRGVE